MEHLDALASMILKDPGNSVLLAAFAAQLRSVDDVCALRALAEIYTPHTEIACPLYRRILVLQSDDTQAMVALGFALWLDGEDEAASQLLEEAKRLDPEHLDVLTLAAALTRDPYLKRQFYTKILAQDPTNTIALENVRQLEASGLAV